MRVFPFHPGERIRFGSLLGQGFPDGSGLRLFRRQDVRVLRGCGFFDSGRFLSRLREGGHLLRNGSFSGTDRFPPGGGNLRLHSLPAGVGEQVPVFRDALDLRLYGSGDLFSHGVNMNR